MIFGKLSSYFWLASFLFVVNQFLEKAGIFIPFVHSYLDDFLCPGIVLGIALFVQQNWVFKDRRYIFGIGPLVFFVFWYSLIFEIFLPSFDSRHFADIWDVLAYALGTFSFAYFGNKPIQILSKEGAAPDVKTSV